jgi:hypothetical protein
LLASLSIFEPIFFVAFHMKPLTKSDFHVSISPNWHLHDCRPQETLFRLIVVPSACSEYRNQTRPNLSIIFWWFVSEHGTGGSFCVESCSPKEQPRLLDGLSLPFRRHVRSLPSESQPGAAESRSLEWKRRGWLRRGRFARLFRGWGCYSACYLLVEVLTTTFSSSEGAEKGLETSAQGGFNRSGNCSKGRNIVRNEVYTFSDSDSGGWNREETVKRNQRRVQLRQGLAHDGNF